MTRAAVSSASYSLRPQPRIELAPLFEAPLNKVKMYTEERVHRLAAAVALVEHGGPTGKASVRTAGRMYGIPKSTLHRYIQANRAVKLVRSRRGCTKRILRTDCVAPPPKCGISFILNQDSEPVYRDYRMSSFSSTAKPSSVQDSDKQPVLLHLTHSTSFRLPSLTYCCDTLVSPAKSELDGDFKSSSFFYT
eukprot:IDg12396t1